jgi:hypothetical protein
LITLDLFSGVRGYEAAQRIEQADAAEARRERQAEQADILFQQQQDAYLRNAELRELQRRAAVQATQQGLDLATLRGPEALDRERFNIDFSQRARTALAPQIDERISLFADQQLNNARAGAATSQANSIKAQGQAALFQQPEYLRSVLEAQALGAQSTRNTAEQNVLITADNLLRASDPELRRVGQQAEALKIDMGLLDQHLGMGDIGKANAVLAKYGTEMRYGENQIPEVRPRGSNAPWQPFAGAMRLPSVNAYMQGLQREAKIALDRSRADLADSRAEAVANKGTPAAVQVTPNNPLGIAPKAAPQAQAAQAAAPQGAGVDPAIHAAALRLMADARAQGRAMSYELAKAVAQRQGRPAPQVTPAVRGADAADLVATPVMP